MTRMMSSLMRMMRAGAAQPMAKRQLNGGRTRPNRYEGPLQGAAEQRRRRRQMTRMNNFQAAGAAPKAA